MCLQVGELDGLVAVVVEAQIAIFFGSSIDGPPGSFDDLKDDLAKLSDDAYEDEIERWLTNLPKAPPLTVVDHYQAMAYLQSLSVFVPPATLPTPPPAPAAPFGHLPFRGHTTSGDEFYRYEAFPTSRRLVAPMVANDTFAAPESEIQFMPTGLSAVGRLALPSLLPARYRYKLVPPVTTPLTYGASVPLFGQSGGGVEVCFPSGFVFNPTTVPPPRTVLNVL